MVYLLMRDFWSPMFGEKMSKTTLKRLDGTIIAEGDATIAELSRYLNLSRSTKQTCTMPTCEVLI